MYVGLKSTIAFLPNTTVYWEKNYANLGGAIYVDDVSTLSYCYKSLIGSYIPKENNAFFNFMTRIYPVFMFNSFSRTTLLMMQEVCYMVVQ